MQSINGLNILERLRPDHTCGDGSTSPYAKIQRYWSFLLSAKRLLVLANSIKKNARCVAGREKIVEGEEVRIGHWIRPVSEENEGKLFRRHYALSQGGVTHVLDVVDIPLLGRRDDPGQPENWVIDENADWSKVEVYSTSGIHGLAETPADLWLEAGGRPDRISVDLQGSRDPQSSLVLIAPQDFRVRMWREHNPFRGYTQKKTRAVFEYNQQRYALSITDPVFSSNHCAQHPQQEGKVLEITPPCGDQCLLCVSLTPPFQGYHYKVVATVLELP